jgi:hypothetical protein
MFKSSNLPFFFVMVTFWMHEMCHFSMTIQDLFNKEDHNAFWSFLSPKCGLYPHYHKESLIHQSMDLHEDSPIQRVGFLFLLTKSFTNHKSQGSLMNNFKMFWGSSAVQLGLDILWIHVRIIEQNVGMPFSDCDPYCLSLARNAE